MKNLKQLFNRSIVLLIVLALVFGGLSALFTQKAVANQLTSRKLTLSTAVVSASPVTYTFDFTLGQTAAVQGLKFQACTTALGSCVSGPTGLSFSSRAFGSQSSWTNATNFAVDATGANDCTAAANVICANRTQAANETAGARSINFTTITNPSGASCASSNPNCTFFVRITTYSTNTYTVGSILDTGTVASSTTATLTISAVIQEVLSFCIGSTAINNDSSSPGADCSAISGTSVNLGTLDSGTVSVTPVAGTGTGFGVNGIAMLKTNASGTTSVTYKPIAAGSGTNHLGGLRVTGASCNAGNVNNDQCINSSASQSAFTAGVENFGMTVAGTNCGATVAYSCSLTGGTNNLKASSGYIGATATSFGTGTGFQWNESTTPAQIASATGAVDNEALILKFAATPNAVTPTGSYSVQTDFIVIPTF